MKMKVVKHTKDIPAFKNEAEERAFWDQHEADTAFFEGAEDPLKGVDLERSHYRPADASVAISLRLEKDLKQRLVALAKAKGMAYQTLLKQFLTERIYEEEKRAGVYKG
jgi:predicted DNA binding CopG/RHH family protein